MTDKSWRINFYQEGKYTVSVRQNLENDRVDEGDYPKDTIQKETKKVQD